MYLGRKNVILKVGKRKEGKWMFIFDVKIFYFYVIVLEIFREIL